jgi:hypothetical protein
VTPERHPRPRRPLRRGASRLTLRLGDRHRSVPSEPARDCLALVVRHVVWDRPFRSRRRRTRGREERVTPAGRWRAAPAPRYTPGMSDDAFAQTLRPSLRAALPPSPSSATSPRASRSSRSTPRPRSWCSSSRRSTICDGRPRLRSNARPLSVSDPSAYSLQDSGRYRTGTNSPGCAARGAGVTCAPWARLAVEARSVFTSHRSRRSSFARLGRQAVLASAVITLGLGHPVADRLRRRLELLRQLVRILPGTHHLDQPVSQGKLFSRLREANSPPTLSAYPQCPLYRPYGTTRTPSASFT